MSDFAFVLVGVMVIGSWCAVVIMGVYFIKESRRLAEKALMSEKAYKPPPELPEPLHSQLPDNPTEAFMREQDELKEMERILTEGRG